MKIDNEPKIMMIHDEELGLINILNMVIEHITAMGNYLSYDSALSFYHGANKAIENNDYKFYGLDITKKAKEIKMMIETGVQGDNFE